MYKLTAFKLSTWTGPKLYICHLNLKISKILNKTIQDCFKYQEYQYLVKGPELCQKNLTGVLLRLKKDEITMPSTFPTPPPTPAIVADIRHRCIISIYRACKPTSNQLSAYLNHWPSATKCLCCKTK